MAEPDITVVIPCYNAERWVARAIRSVLAQEGMSVEVIVVDDGSTDASLDVVKSFGDRIRWESGPNRGACAARNLGLSLAAGPFVIFLDADDYLEGPFLSDALTALRATGADLGFGPLKVAWPDRTVMRIPPATLATALDALRLVYSSYSVQPVTVVLRRDFAAQVGGWCERLHRFQDKEFITRCLAQNPKVCGWDQGFGVFVQHASPGRISARSDDAAFASQVESLRRCAALIRKVEGAGEPELEQLRCNGYQMLRTAARTGNPRQMEAAQALFRELGGRRHYGSVWHRLGVAAVGLHSKERVAAALARHGRGRQVG